MYMCLVPNMRHGSTVYLAFEISSMLLSEFLREFFSSFGG